MKDCAVCYQISCKRCGWIATKEEVELVQKQILTACPECGWKPGEDVEILDFRL